MKILAYLNISNIDDIECDSGYIFNYLLAEAFDSIDVEYYIILPTGLREKPLQFNKRKCYFVNMGTTKYEARYHFEWDDIEMILQEVNPDIIFNNQVEMAAQFRVILEKINLRARLFTYCHYPALHIGSCDDVVIDSSLNMYGIGENIVYNVLCAVNLSDVFFIQSNFAKKMLLDYAAKKKFEFNKEIAVVPPPYDIRMYMKDFPENNRKKVLYNHRLYDSYGTQEFIDFVKNNSDIHFVVSDPMINRGIERNKYNNSPYVNRTILTEQRNVTLFDGSMRNAYFQTMDECRCAIAPHRKACVWSMSVIDCFCRWVPVVAPDIAAFSEFVPKQLLFTNVKKEREIIGRLFEDSFFWEDSILKCRSILDILSPLQIARCILEGF